MPSLYVTLKSSSCFIFLGVQYEQRYPAIEEYLNQTWKSRGIVINTVKYMSVLFVFLSYVCLSCLIFLSLLFVCFVCLSCMSVRLVCLICLYCPSHLSVLSVCLSCFCVCIVFFQLFVCLSLSFVCLSCLYVCLSRLSVCLFKKKFKGRGGVNSFSPYSNLTVQI